MEDFSELAIAMATEFSEAQSNVVNVKKAELQAEIEKNTAEFESLPNGKIEHKII